MTQNDVRAFYDAFGEREWARLAQPADGALEFAITCHTLAKYLLSNGSVLDLWGGPGRYSLWLEGLRAHRSRCSTA